MTEKSAYLERGALAYDYSAKASIAKQPEKAATVHTGMITGGGPVRLHISIFSL